MYNIKLSERDEAKSIINDYSTLNLMTLINLFIFMKRERSASEIF